MSGILAMLTGGGGKPMVQYVGATSGADNTTAQAPAAARVGDFGLFATYSQSNSSDPPGGTWTTKTTSEDKLCWRILTASDLTATRLQGRSWAFLVYRGPVRAGFRAVTGFTKSASYIGLCVQGLPNNPPSGAQYVDRKFTDNQSYTIDIFDNFAPLPPYSDNAQISSRAPDTDIALELLSA